MHSILLTRLWKGKGVRRALRLCCRRRRLPQVLLALPSTYVHSQSYQCRAWATNDAGEGDASASVVFYTPPSAPLMTSVKADDGRIFAYVSPPPDSGNKRECQARIPLEPCCAVFLHATQCPACTRGFACRLLPPSAMPPCLQPSSSTGWSACLRAGWAAL